MKKIVMSLVAAITFAAISFAYNPPVQGENLFYLAHPETLTSGVSTAGGGILSVIPATTTINPALGALESRITLDLGYTMMFDSIGPDKYGQAFGTGIIIPTDWATFAGEIEGIFVPFWNMHLGNSFNMRTSAAKQIMENLYIGVGLGFGAFWKYGNDWMLTADVGAIYNFGDIAFLKNFRVGASVNNLGKVYTKTDSLGIKGALNSSDSWDGFPYFATFRTGAAAELIQTENFVLGLSFDVTTPLFQNLIFDSGVQVEICDFVKINSSWELNVAEADKKCNSWIPTIGVVFKFNIGTGFLNKSEWAKSEISPSAAWKNVDGDINLISIGAALRLGELDKEGPDIEVE